MRRALTLARRGEGHTSPNPPVGCVIVKDGKIIAEGYHRGPGTPHAEIDALTQLNDRTQGLEFFVTLEPCVAFPGKRTPACAETLLDVRPRRVVVGCEDPNPAVAGRGIRVLREAGISVEIPVLAAPSQRLIEGFAKHSNSGLPFVTLKHAISLDGKLATRCGDSKWISNAQARRHVHRMRHRADAILVGAGTIAADDPQLTARPGRDPLRVILDSKLTTDPGARVFAAGDPSATIIATTRPIEAPRAAAYCATIHAFTAQDGAVPLGPLLNFLGQRGVVNLLVEGGSRVSTAFLQAGLVDRLVLFIAPVIIGADGIPFFAAQGIERVAEALRLTETEVRRVGDNVMLSGRPGGQVG